MRRSRGRTRPAAWWVRLGLVVLGAIVLAWLVFVTSGPRAFPRLAAGSPLDPTATNRLFRSAGEQLLAKGGDLTADTYDQIAEAATRAPLAQQPFMYFAVRRLAQQDLGGAERLLLEARRRNPRDELTRLLLVSAYLQSGRVAQSARELETLLRIMPNASELLIPEFAKLALQPRSRGALVEAVGDSPLMAQLLDHLASRGADPELILALAARQPRPVDGAFRPWRTYVLEKYIASGQARRAYALWLRFVGREQAPNGAVYDANFEGLPGPPPFNWLLSPSVAGSVEFGAGPALEVTYFGRTNGTLAGQLMLLAPGTYTFEVEAEGDAKGEDSRLEWRITCRNGDRLLLELPVQKVSFAPKTLAGRFTVPGDCDAQRLQLAGKAAEFPSVQSVRFAGLEIRRAGDAR